MSGALTCDPSWASTKCEWFSSSSTAGGGRVCGDACVKRVRWCALQASGVGLGFGWWVWGGGSERRM
eukprot:3523602-Rhodomonas_salina.5